MKLEIAKGTAKISASADVKAIIIILPALIIIPKAGLRIPIMAVAVFFNIPSTSMSGICNFSFSLLAYYLICFIRLFWVFSSLAQIDCREWATVFYIFSFTTSFILFWTNLFSYCFIILLISAVFSFNSYEFLNYISRSL